MKLHNQANNFTLIALLCILFSAWVFLFTDLYLYSKLGLILFVIITLKFVDNTGKGLPVKEMIGMIMLLQLLVAPVVCYNYFNNETRYPMDIDEPVYINYVFSGICCFLSGLFIPLKKRQQKVIESMQKIQETAKLNNKIGIALILIGYAAMYLSRFVPESLNFLFFLVSNFRFIGAFYMFLSNNPFKYLWIFFVFASFAIGIVEGGIFINLFVWGLFLSSFMTFVFRIGFLPKLSLFIAGFFLAFFIQIIKGEYRDVVWGSKAEDKAVEDKPKVFMDIAEAKVQDTEKIYDYGNTNDFIARLNQGWILAKVLDHVPYYEPYSDGEMLAQDIRAAILPRVLDPGKVRAGGDENRIKFTKYTGRRLVGFTTMNIGVLGDGYANFGFLGAMIFMFVFGFFLNLILTYIHSLSLKYPSLILWIPFIFFYTMRAGNDFHVILNFITKASLVVFIFFFIFKRRFKLMMPIVSEHPVL